MREVLLSFVSFLTCILAHDSSSQHHSEYVEHHSLHDDQIALLGKEMAEEFDKLTPEEARRRLRRLVPHIDSNKDGFVDAIELEAWVKEKMKKWTVHEDVGGIFSDADMNADQKLDWDEYMFRIFGFKENDMHLKWERSELNVYIEEDRRKWKFADIDGDGFLTREEFEYFYHPREHEIMLKYIATITLEEADKDLDGFVSLEEFLDHINQPAFSALDKEDFNTKYDTNKDGKLDLDEVMIWKRPKNFNQAQGEALHLIEYADEDKDNKLTADEIVASYQFFSGSYATHFGQVLHDEF